jgi:hypothetical protein
MRLGETRCSIVGVKCFTVVEINVIDSGFLLRVSMVSWQHLD